MRSAAARPPAAAPPAAMAPPTPVNPYDGLEDMNLTADEINRFEEAFKDEKFKEMFMEYAKEISDPKNREENDAYLRQMEEEGKAESVYGKGVELVVPNAGFVVKTKGKKDGGKVFINLVYSEKVQDATSQKVNGGHNWSVPFSIGVAHEEQDKGGEKCTAFDVCVGAGTYRMTESNPRFKDLVIDTAMDAVEKQRETKLDRAFKLPKLVYKGPETGPGVQAVRQNNGDGKDENGKGGDAKDRIRPVGNPGMPGAPADQAVGKPMPGPPPSASLFSFDKVLKPKQKKAPEPEPEPKEHGEVVPKYTIVHRGKMEMKAGWGDTRVHETQDLPVALVVRVELPKLDSIAGVDLDVNEKNVTLHAAGKYLLELPLPFKVDSDAGKAKWDKTKRSLEVTLPVVKPKLEAAKPFVEPVDVPDEPQGDDTEEVEDTKTPPAPASSEDSPTQQQPLAPAEVEEPTETRGISRRWREMHTQPAAEPVAAPAAAPAAGASAPAVPVAAPAKPTAPAPTPTQRLKPRVAPAAAADMLELD